MIAKRANINHLKLSLITLLPLPPTSQLLCMQLHYMCNQYFQDLFLDVDLLGDLFPHSFFIAILLLPFFLCRSLTPCSIVGIYRTFKLFFIFPVSAFKGHTFAHFQCNIFGNVTSLWLHPLMTWLIYDLLLPFFVHPLKIQLLI